MASDSGRRLIVGLDIGTSKVAAIVGEITVDGDIEIIGIGSHRSRGLKKGVVVNIESTVQSIQRAVEEAELMAGCHIEEVYAGIAGSHVRSLNSHGIVAIRDREVFPQDIERVIDAAQAVAIPADQKVLHILPQEYLVDNQEGVREPLGMSGVRLEAKVHLVTCAVNAAQNVEKCIERCGLEGQGRDPRATRVELRRVVGRRTRTRRVSGRHRRRHDRHRGVHRRRHSAHGGHSDRRRSGHQRHRNGAAHADAECRRDQDQVRLRADAARARRRDDQSSRASATSRRRNCRARRWRKWWSRATTNCSRWCRPNCGAAASRI